jgi:pimeloyl-ACP methyl ester carboxylesterase
VSPVAVLLHGAGSCPQTARRLLATAAPPDAEVIAPTWRGTVDDALAALEHAVDGRRVALVGGISLGAHATALWAARTRSEVPLVLAMPAWTGAPDDVAAATLASADDVARRGSAAVLADLAADPVTARDWVLDELARGWSTYDDDALATGLRLAARSAAPGVSDLARLAGPVAVVALADDPLHPEGVARRWAAAAPRARIMVVPRDAPSDDRGLLGRVAAHALAELSGSR